MLSNFYYLETGNTLTGGLFLIKVSELRIYEASFCSGTDLTESKTLLCFCSDVLTCKFLFKFCSIPINLTIGIALWQV